MNRYKKRVTLKEEAKKYILDPESADIFKNNNPVEIEVGFGTGKFICEYAKNNPEINILGIEITRKNGNGLYIAFDTVGYLLNDEGKTIERIR